MDPRLRKHLGETGQLGNSARRKDYGSGLGHTSRKPAEPMGASTSTSSSSGHLNDRLSQVQNFEQEPRVLDEPIIAPQIVPRPLPPTFIQNGQLPHVAQQLNGLGNSKPKRMGGFGKKMGVGLLAAGVGVGIWYLMAGKDGGSILTADDFMDELGE
tara:strand:- start:1650 stop:2117 length:468 start_codon:yes stop_codon:yes gene_type:complete